MNDVIETMARFVAAVRADDYDKLREDTQKIYQDQAGRCIDALRAAGYAVVPREPSKKQTARFWAAYGSKGISETLDEWWRRVYRAMIEAAEGGG